MKRASHRGGSNAPAYMTALFVVDQSRQEKRRRDNIDSTFR